MLINSVSGTGMESGVKDVLLLVFLQTFWYVWGQGWVERPYHCVDIQFRRRETSQQYSQSLGSIRSYFCLKSKILFIYSTALVPESMKINNLFYE